MHTIKNDKYLLIKYCDYVDDEILIEGFSVLSEKDWEKNVEIISEIISTYGGYALHVGGGSHIKYFSVNELLENCAVYEIAHTEAEFMIENFLDTYDYFGHFPSEISVFQ